MSNPGFQGRSNLVFVVAALSIALLFGAFFFGSPPLDTDRDYAGPDGKSALGTGAFVEWLRAKGETVNISSARTLGKLSEGDGIFVLEPRVPKDGTESLESYLYETWLNGTLVVVLPKRVGRPDPSHAGWIEFSRLRNAAVPKAALDLAVRVALDIGHYKDGEFHWSDDERGVDPASGAEGHVYRHGLPTIHDTTLVLDDTQTMGIEGMEWEEILSHENGPVVGRLAPDFYVISDPDLFSNAGIGRGSNAEAMAILISLFDNYSGRIWMDESVHFSRGGGGIWGELFRFPLILVSLHVIAFALLAAWAGTQRFGPRKSFAPRFHAGREHLLDHTADLLQLAGHGGDSLARYLSLVESEVSHALGWGDLPRPERRKRLLALGQSTGARESDSPARDYAALKKEIDDLAGKKLGPSALLEAAHRIDAWRTETLYGRRFDGAR